MNQIWGEIDLDLEVRFSRSGQRSRNCLITEISLFPMVIFGLKKKYKKNCNTKTIKATLMRLIPLFKLEHKLSNSISFILIKWFWKFYWTASCQLPFCLSAADRLAGVSKARVPSLYMTFIVVNFNLIVKLCSYKC